MNAAMRLSLAICGVLPCQATSADADTLYLSGTVGPYPVLLALQRDGPALDGWYVYLRQDKQIRLDGKVAKDGHFSLDEETALSNEKTGRFDGTIADGRWRGRWTGMSGKSLPFILREDGHELAGQSGAYFCRTRKTDAEFGYTYTQTLKLGVDKGRVTQFETARSERGSGGEEQGCQIGLSDLRPAESSSGMLLRAKGDQPNGEGPHCSVRILGTGEWLYVQMGDPTEPDNDCKGAGDTMYCSPRAFWTDMVVDTKTNSCKSVE